MKRLINILIFILCLAFGTTMAHQDAINYSYHGNVLIRYQSGSGKGEDDKAEIIGKLAENLATKLNYKAMIFLDFNHCNNCVKKYNILYNQGEIEDRGCQDSVIRYMFDTKTIIIEQFVRKFDVSSTLQLLEYTIKNIELIKSSHKQIDTNEIKEQISKPTSNLLKAILSERIEKPNQDFKYGISYFWQNNKFHIFIREEGKYDFTLLSLDNFFYIENLSTSTAIVFDTDSSFFYIHRRQLIKSDMKTYFEDTNFRKEFDNPIASKRQVIKNTDGNYRPFQIKNIAEDKISISFQYYSYSIPEGNEKRRTLIYLIRKDELIQDLDELIEKR